MLVGDLIYNDSFDIGCSYKIHDCSGIEEHDDWSYVNASVIYDSEAEMQRPSDSILDMEVCGIYVTANAYLVIDVKRV